MFQVISLSKKFWKLLLIINIRGCQKFGIKVYWRLQFLGYLRTLSLKFQKARTKIEVVLSLPCWLSQLPSIYLVTLKFKKMWHSLINMFDLCSTLCFKIGPYFWSMVKVVILLECPTWNSNLEQTLLATGCSTTKCDKVNQYFNMLNLKIVYGFQHVSKITAFELWPLDLVKSNITTVLHSLSSEGWQNFN